MKFKKGMKVRLIGHSLASDHNLEIGAKGVVVDIEPQQQQTVHVKWGDYEICPDWWVTDDIIRPINFQLENK